MSPIPSLLPAGFAIVYVLILEGRVRYVGQTITPARRIYQHQCNLRSTAVQMLMVRVVLLCDVRRIEKQVIAAYRRRGAADLNGKLHIGSPKYAVAPEPKQLGYKPAAAIEYLGSEERLRACLSAKWLSPVFQRGHLTLYSGERLRECLQRILSGESPRIQRK